MFDFFRTVKRRADAIKIADKVAPILIEASGMELYFNDRKRFSEIAVQDDFILSYFYGVIVCSIGSSQEQLHPETTGYFLMEIFERLFPGFGQSALEKCNIRRAEGDEKFASGGNLGFEEMEKAIGSIEAAEKEVKILYSLHRHILQLPLG